MDGKKRAASAEKKTEENEEVALKSAANDIRNMAINHLIESSG